MLHIIQNDPQVPPGNIIEHLPVPCILHHPYHGDSLPAPEQISALIVMGGAMGANDELKYAFLADVKELLRLVVAAGIPYLGICLGGQLLAAALGAKVESNHWEELGTLPVTLTAQGSVDPLFSGIGSQFSTFQWHHDSFELPAGSLLLAGSNACPHQAFRVGTSAWGLQFHPEVTAEIIRDWCAWDSATAVRTDELLAGFDACSGQYQATARQLVHNFTRIAGLT